MASQSPPKPWERGDNAAAPTSQTVASPSAPGTSATSTSVNPPNLPPKPASLSSVVNRTATAYSNPYASGAAAGPYGGLGGYGAYSSPYSRFGGMYGSGYGGMYGAGYGGMYGGGYPGQPGMMGAGDPNSLTNTFNQSTQATFQMIEGIVGAFGGFAQMLESTYMATHQSFYAMIGVAEQFSNLRDTLGSILGIFTLIRWIKTLFAKLTGRPPPASSTALTPSAFARFQGQPSHLPDGSPLPPRPSKRPLVVFILAAFGLPYLMGKLIRSLARSQEEAAAAAAAAQQQQQPIVLDPMQLDFCRLRYDYDSGTNPPVPGVDLSVKKDDVVVVLAKTDPSGNPSDWWRCRTRDARIGYLPSPYLELIERRQPQQAPGIANGGNSQSTTMTSTGAGGEQQRQAERAQVPAQLPEPGRAQTMSTVDNANNGGDGGSRAASLNAKIVGANIAHAGPEKVPVPVPAPPLGQAVQKLPDDNMTDLLERLQKSQFYS